MNLFGKKKTGSSSSGPTPRLQDSIQALNSAQDMLEKRQKHLEKQIDAQKVQAKEKLKNKDKRGAILLLKRAKLYENELNKIMGKMQNLDVQKLALESASLNKDVLGAMVLGKNALKAAATESDIDKVADVMEDINESIQMADELSDALAAPIGQAIDDDELTAELAAMEAELVDQQLLETPAIPSKTTTTATTTPATTVTTPTPAVSLPDVPTKPVGQVTTSSSSSSSSSSSASKAKLTQQEQAELDSLNALMA